MHPLAFQAGSHGISIFFCMLLIFLMLEETLDFLKYTSPRLFSMELGVLEDTVIENSLDADLNTVIETRMIRDQFKVLEGMI